jgi:WD40 repeat protein
MSAVFSPDGQEVLTSSRDGTAKIWGAASGECLRTLEDQWMSVSSASFSPL